MKLATLSQLTQAIETAFNQTELNYVDCKYVDELLAEQGLGANTMLLSQTGKEIKNLVISTHGFLAQFRAEYEEEAKKNISAIYYGPKGLVNIGGGCCYVFVR